MNHHLHESAKKKSRKLATFCFILFLKKKMFIYLRIFQLKQTMIPAWIQIIKRVGKVIASFPGNLVTGERKSASRNSLLLYRRKHNSNSKERVK